MPNNTFFTVDRLNAHYNEVKQKLRTGVPAQKIPLTLLVEIGGFYFESNPGDFRSWSHSMLKELGEELRPLLWPIWKQIPLAVNKYLDHVVSPTMTQRERTELMLRCRDIVDHWKQSDIQQKLNDEIEPMPHDHFCPVCKHNWNHTEPECRLPDEYWCHLHVGCGPLPTRLKSDMHDHYCQECFCYWGHENRDCRLPEIYSCAGHGGIVDDEPQFLPAKTANRIAPIAAVSSRPPGGFTSRSNTHAIQTVEGFSIRRGWPILAAAAVSTAWILSPFNIIPALLLLAIALMCGFNLLRKHSSSIFLRAVLVFLVFFVPTGMLHDAFFDHPTAVCADGWYSYSADHQGTCSWHGGVSRWNPERTHWWQF
jgi:hypothetical protein